MNYKFQDLVAGHGWLREMALPYDLMVILVVADLLEKTGQKLSTCTFMFAREE